MTDLGVHVIITALTIGPDSAVVVLPHQKTESYSVPVIPPFRIPEGGHSPKTSNPRRNILWSKPF